MSPAAKTTAILYVSQIGGGNVDAFASSTWKPLGAIFGLVQPFAMCVDVAQDVYVPDASTHAVSEYAHGSFAPMRTLADHQGTPTGCAVDPKTGNLAIANFVGPSSTNGSVIVYAAAKGSPTKYTVPNLTNCSTVAYDDKSNLFVDGGQASVPGLAELPAGKTAFKALHMNQAIAQAAGIAWDGKFLAYGDQGNHIIYQFAISGSNANVQGSTLLNGATSIFQFWLSGASAKHPQATSVTATEPNGNAIGKWDYPAGGTPLKTLGGFNEPIGVVISQ